MVRKLIGACALLLLLALVAGCAAATTPTAAPTATSRPAGGATTAPAPAATATPTKAPAATPTPRPLEKVRLRLDWTPSSYHAAFYIGQVKGFYAEQGIDIDIQDGKGSGTTLNLVATKADVIGFADGGTMIKQIVAGGPVKMIAAMFRRAGSGLWALSKNTLKTPKDLEGKSVALIPGEAFSMLFPAFIEVNKLDKSKIREVTADYSNKDALVLTEKADVTIGFPPVEVCRFGPQGHKIDELAYSDFGLSLVGHGLVVHNDTIKEKPDLLKRFVAASIKSWDYAVKNVEESVDAMRKIRTDDPQTKESRLCELKDEWNLLYSENTKGWPLGKMSDKDWQFTIDMLNNSGQLKGTVPKAADVFTNDLLPKQ